ncbi:MAG: MFS transporter [Acidobacteria bacterium]|nr:MFS transporter [Acidobacteriota bacterium]
MSPAQLARKQIVAMAADSGSERRVPHSMERQAQSHPESWLNRTTVGIGLTSLFSDWCHEIATTILPAFLATLGAGPGWLGVIEGTSDGLSSVAKLAAGHYTDRLRKRKPLVLAGYVVTAVATGALALAGRGAHVLAARVVAWIGRGARTPGRKAILAAAVPASAYGRAFGFERLMDTTGAIVGPLTAFSLLQLYSGDYRPVFLWTLLPGLLAVLCFILLVRERPSAAVPARLPFVASLRGLPAPYRRFLLAVGLFGLGDFAHTLLILYAMQALTPQWGVMAAASAATALYVLHNVFYAGFAYLAGWLGDRSARHKVLAAGYALGIPMALLLATGTQTLLGLGAVFVLGGICVGTEEALEDSLAAELVPTSQHGMAFGTLAAVNAVGDFASSLLVGILWSTVSAPVAFFGVSALFGIGSLLMLRLRR